MLRGDRLVNSLYKMHFTRDVQRVVVCEKHVTEADVKMWKALRKRDRQTVSSLSVAVIVEMQKALPLRPDSR